MKPFTIAQFYSHLITILRNHPAIVWEDALISEPDSDTPTAVMECWHKERKLTFYFESDYVEVLKVYKVNKQLVIDDQIVQSYECLEALILWLYE